MKREFWRQTLVLLPVLLAISLPFWFTDLDRRISSLFYAPELGKFLRAAQPWHFAYKWGCHLILLTLVISVACSVRYVARRTRLHSAWYVLYFAMVLMLGPSFLTNSVLKDHWGRPRPVEIREFGGEQLYHTLWQRGMDKGSKSFPSGHAAIGFSFLAFFPMLRRYHKRAAYRFLAAGILSGLIMGTGRIVQGGHFLSDVLWSGAVVYITVMACYYPILRIPVQESRALAGAAPHTLRPVTIYAVLTLLTVSCGLLATPFFDQNTEIVPHSEAGEDLDILLDLPVGNVILKPAGNPPFALSIRASAHGYGWPGSRLNGSVKVSTADGCTTISYRPWKSGIFVRLAADFEVEIDAALAARIRVRAAEGRVHEPAVADTPQNWSVEILRGT